MRAPFLLVWLDRIFVLTALVPCVAWVVQYSRHDGWGNSLGRTLLLKTSILSALLAVSAVSVWGGLGWSASIALAWVSVCLLGLIGPVLTWRIIVFHRIPDGLRTCPNGHRVLATARFCPQCGTPVGDAGPVPGRLAE